MRQPHPDGVLRIVVMAALAKIMVVGHVRYLQFRYLERPMGGSKKSRRVRTWSTWRERESKKKQRKKQEVYK